MSRHRFYFIEPSKIDNQHITLIEGYLSALMLSVKIKEKYDLFLYASSSTLAMLPSTLKSEYTCSVIPVMNAEKRRLILKTLVELFVVFRCLVKLRRGDILFISCVLPTTLWLLEYLNRLLGKSGVHVVLHGEIEGLFDITLQNFQSYGFWSKKWIHSRTAESRIMLVVLDDFIREKLVLEFPDKLDAEIVSVVHLPIVALSPMHKEGDSLYPSVCFVGYRSRFKGYDDFVHLATKHPTIKFLAIGGSKVEDVKTGAIKELVNNDSYINEISKCAAAIFPYTSLYSCSLSAAAVDALASGVPIIALDRACFSSLASYFGSEMVTVCSSVDKISQELEDGKLLYSHLTKEARLGRLSSSKYSLASVQESFEKLAIIQAS